MFNDFPAEIFLQRSFILKILIDLIIKSTSLNTKENEDLGLTNSLISCIHFYCIKLKKRVDYVKDPSTFCYKGDTFLNLFIPESIINKFICLFKDFYSNDFENYSKSIYSSFNLKKDKKQNLKYNKENMNLSLYSNDNFNSVISSIDSSSILSAKNNNNKTNKTNMIQKSTQKSNKKEKSDIEDNEFDSQIDEHFNQDLQM